MHKFITALCMSLAGFISIAQAQPDDRPAKSIDSLVAQQFTGNQPGISILIAKKGQIVYQKAFGSANVELSVPLQPEMVFDLGSITKQFTAVAILQLVEQGKIALTDSIQRYIKDFPSKGHTITIENLLTHTSGIPDYMQLDTGDPYAERKDFTPKEIIDLFKTLPLQFEPGTKFSYSNSGYFLLGYVIAQVSGENYYKYVQDHILSPLGLNRTFFNHQNEIIPGHVSGYKKDGDQYKKADYWSATLPYAAGDLVSNTADLFKWHQALHAGKVLKKETLDKAFVSYILKDGTSAGYGYGWYQKDFNGIKSIGHGGAITGFLTDEMYYPDQDVYVVILCNCECIPKDELTLAISGIALGKPLQLDLTFSASVLNRYTGTYAMLPDQKRIMIITKEGDHLVGNFQGQGSFQVLFQSETTFAFKGIPGATGQFILDNGKVTKFIVQQNGQYEWKKLK
jgi:CubicO group peptidase (beta-lactamase class C family)